MPDYLHKGDYVLGLELKMANREIAEPNLGYILGFKRHLELKNRKPQTIARIIRELRFILRPMRKDAAAALRPDIEEIVVRINTSGKAPVSKRKLKQTLRAFYKWLSNSDTYPDIVRWVVVDSVTVMKLPEEMLTEEEVRGLIGACRNSRDRAIIALLFDTGIRIGELLGLKVKDVVLNKDAPSYAMVDGKTGKRRVTLVLSVPYLANYLNGGLEDSSPESHLFTTRYRDMFDYSNVRKLLHDLKERTGLKKRLYAHLFRHSRASMYANSMTEQQLKMYFGWAGGSQMAAIYVHLSGKDVDNAVLKANGIVKEDDESLMPKLTSRACCKCHDMNEATAKYCVRCGTPLDANYIDQGNYANELKKELDTLKSAIDLLMSRVDAETKEKIMNIVEEGA